jgi:hypothetical protein
VLYCISAHGFCTLLVPDVLRIVLSFVFLSVQLALDLVLVSFTTSIEGALARSDPGLAVALIIPEKMELSKTIDSTTGWCIYCS